jgi:hypothetical protein
LIQKEVPRGNLNTTNYDWLIQLRLANKKLKEELEKYEAKTKPKTKKHCMDNNVEHIRARCLRKKSPEW